MIRWKVLAALLVFLIIVSKSAPQECRGSYTAYMVLDGSKSIQESNFLVIKNALKGFVNQSLSTTVSNRIGFVVYSDFVTDKITASSDLNSLVNQIDKVNYPNSGTATHLGIRVAMQLLRDDPSLNRRVMVVITDGNSNEPDKTVEAADDAKEFGITMVAVGIEEIVKNIRFLYESFERELRRIASSENLVFKTGLFSGLASPLLEIVQNFCHPVVSLVWPLQDITVVVGSTTVFRVTLTESDAAGGVWKKYGFEINDGDRNLLNVEGANQTLTLREITFADAGEYTFSLGNLTTSGTLTVVASLTDQAANVGNVASFQVLIVPPSESSGFWYKGTQRLFSSDKYTITRETSLRTLAVNNVQPQDVGQYTFTINGLSTSAYLNVQGIAVNGGWTSWTVLNFDSVPCPLTCGFSARKSVTRVRTCTQPAPVNGGLDCEGPSSETVLMNCGLSLTCTIHGEWAAWTEWETACEDVTCGTTYDDLKLRSRSCTNPAPEGGGNFCHGESVETLPITCQLVPCPVDGEWSEWGNWTENCYEVTCGENVPGTRSRRRECDNPPPSLGGRFCLGNFSQSENFICPLDPCPVDGKFGPWSSWNRSECSASCDGGTWKLLRQRKCDQPEPENGGRNCTGDYEEEMTETCNVFPCQVDGSWGQWTEWSLPCDDVTCGRNIIRSRSRRRECDSPPPNNGGEYCPGDYLQSETFTCPLDPCPVDGEFSDWSSWNVPVCPVSCGGGIRMLSRQRKCDQPEPSNGGKNCSGDFEEERTEECNVFLCIVDGLWGEWGAWVLQCDDVTCGEGVLRSRTRGRQCDNPPPSQEGQPCLGSGTELESAVCPPNPCPVDGEFGDWSNWNVPDCPVSCGGGNRTLSRQRKCDRPKPSNGGKNCSGNYEDAKLEGCNLFQCQVDGGFSEWSPWRETCLATCGVNVPSYSARTRRCDNPTPSLDGRDCEGERLESKIGNCSTATICPVDGNWGGWSRWERRCGSRTCGRQIIGARSRSRKCDSPAPRDGGADCIGVDYETEAIDCTVRECPVDGAFGHWTQWNSPKCSVSCGGGIQVFSRSRLCNRPEPKYGGRSCSGPYEENNATLCNEFQCPVDGGFGEWTPWTDTCSATCGVDVAATGRRSRLCDDPTPLNGGKKCSGVFSETRMTSCTVPNCPVDGQFGTWSPWVDTGCSASCGGGLRTFTRNRFCDNPEPQYGGQNCSGDTEQTTIENCNEDPCPVDGIFSDWTQWMETCLATCGVNVIAMLNRTRRCDNPPPMFLGKNCTGHYREVKLANCSTVIRCPVDGQWGEWSPWTNTCDGLTCGTNITGSKSRHRTCDNPAPTFGGSLCIGEPSQMLTLTCSLMACPVDGQFSEWSEWSDPSCSVSCGSGFKVISRNRSCNNPEPQNGGRNCSGDFEITNVKTCNEPFCPIDGNWSDWGDWSNPKCSVSCGPGTRTLKRRRTCSKPLPLFGGKNCSGIDEESMTAFCFLNACPVDGVFGKWSGWNEVCSATCGDNVTAILTRTRLCDNPPAFLGGRNCSGNFTEEQVGLCSNVPDCPVDGQWGQWSEWLGRCPNITCGRNVTGIRSRSRQCDNPSPSDNGSYCTGGGSQIETRICSFDPCPIDGEWGSWTEWLLNCDNTTCGRNVSGARSRTRSCTNPPPTDGGKFCQGSGFSLEEIVCPIVPCPDLCDDVIRRNDVGYRQHPTECDKYIQCYFNPNGQDIAVIRSCPFGHYWNQAKFICEDSRRINCHLEIYSSTTISLRKMTGSCRSYWRQGERTHGKCCPEGYSFVHDRGCRHNVECEDLCPNPFIKKCICHKRPAWNGSFYQVFIDGIEWTNSSCPKGAFFDIVNCDCSDLTRGTCEASYSVFFNTTVFPSWMTSSGVDYIDESAIFDNEDTVTFDLTWRERTNPIAIKFRYRESYNASGRRGLLKTSDHNRDSALDLSVDVNALHIRLKSRNNDITVQTLPTTGILRCEWKTVALLYNDHDLVISVESGHIKYLTKIYVSDLDLIQWLTFNPNTDFIGALSMISFFQCDPGLTV